MKMCVEMYGKLKDKVINYLTKKVFIMRLHVDISNSSYLLFKVASLGLYTYITKYFF